MHTENTIERFNLSRLKSCSEPWDRMVPNECGRLCAKCDKTIHDFRGMTDREVAMKHAFSEESLCGIYDPHHLRKPQKPKAKPFRFDVRALYLSALSLVFTHTAVAQNKPAKPAQEQTEPGYRHIGQVAQEAAANPIAVTDSIVFYGQVRDENGEPLPFLTVGDFVRKIGTSTDFDGKFRLDLTEVFQSTDSIALTLAYIGYRSQTIVVTKDSPREINMVMNQPENVIAYSVSVRSYPLHKRIWWKISAPFRGWKKHD